MAEARLAGEISSRYRLLMWHRRDGDGTDGSPEGSPTKPTAEPKADGRISPRRPAVGTPPLQNRRAVARNRGRGCHSRTRAADRRFGGLRYLLAG